MKTIMTDYSSLPLFGSNKHDTEFFKRSTALERFYIELAEEFAVGLEQTETFAQTVWSHIQRKGMNKAVFETRTLLNGKTYDRIKNSNLLNPSLNTVMAICIGLGVSGFAAEELLLKAGYRLSNSLLHQVYRKFLYSHKRLSVCECNEILDALRLPLIQPKEYKQLVSDRSHPVT